MKKYVIVTESGADLSHSMIEHHHIRMLPMHVAMDNIDYPDGSISLEQLCGYYDKTGKVPTTSAVNPHEYQEAFESIKEENPDAIIIHISYSSKVSSTFQNAMIASEGMNNIYHIDTLNVSIGQALVVMKAVRLIENCPDILPEELVSQITAYVAATKFSFLPGNLDYLRAGGRVSNAQYLGASLLRLKPLIEIESGLLISTKKYRGSMQKSAGQMVKDFFTDYDIDKNEIHLVYSYKTDEDAKSDAEKYVRELGVKEFVWLQTGCVITSHGGPGAIGIAGALKS